jgi:hypothetical protein
MQWYKKAYSRLIWHLVHCRHHNNQWTWDIHKITSRLLKEGGIQISKTGSKVSPENLRQSAERVVYEVMIAGQLSTLSGWVQHDVRYPDEDALCVSGKDRPTYAEDKDSQVFSQVRAHEQVPQFLDGSCIKPLRWEEIHFRASNQTRGRTMILSTRRHLGRASKATEPGDHIFIRFGLHELAILRPQEDGTYKFIGTAYVHGIMKGEALKGLEQGIFQQKRVSIR